MSWKYTRGNVATKYGDFIGNGFIGREVVSEAELLAHTWFETPTELLKASEPQPSKEVEETRETLIARAEELGIEIDKRWGVQKLREVTA